MLALNEAYLSIVQQTGRARDIPEVERVNMPLMTQNDIKEAEGVVRLYLGGVWRCS